MLKDHLFLLLRKVHFLVFLAIIYSTVLIPRSMVVPELNGGRFGDNMVSLSHALWLAHAYDMDFQCAPFPYSHRLMLHVSYGAFTAGQSHAFKKVVKCTLTTDIVKVMRTAGSNALITIPYFPEHAAEYATIPGYYGIHAPLFTVDWHDQEFLKLLRHLCSPKDPIDFPVLPVDRACVALHLRFGGGFDLPLADGVEGNFSASDKNFPLKCPPLRFYISQLIALHDELDRVPLYVFVFTDERDPGALVERIRPYVTGRDIVFDYRRIGNAHDRNVIEDFMFMQKFPYMIRPQSNLSYMAARLSPSLLIDVDPYAFVWEGKWLNITHARMTCADGREVIKPCYAHLYQ